MDSKKVGSFIAFLRKEKLMTQQDLADKLNVTSKAVSKWETGQGYPEITTIPMLAEILGVTTGELLDGGLTTKESSDMVVATTIINETVKCLDKASSKKADILVAATSVVFLLASCVCILCNYLINHAISWSLYPAGALIVLYSIIFPVIKMKKHKFVGLLLGITITIIPYLFLLQYLTPTKGWVLPLALPITAISLVAFGIALLIFSNTKLNKLYCTSITVFLFGVIVDISIGKIVDSFLKKPGVNNISVLATVLASVLISFVLFVLGYIRRKVEVLERDKK